MTQHLKRHHNFLKKYNAHKEFEDLLALKKTRLNNQKRKNVSAEEERPAKQRKIEECANAKFSRDDPRHVRITNSIASMICTDATPINMVNSEGLKNLMGTVEPRCKVPDYSYSKAGEYRFFFSKRKKYLIFVTGHAKKSVS